ncbi:hypothetical protein ACHAW6_009618 [Cyclotella cf. meneghiniana]
MVEAAIPASRASLFFLLLFITIISSMASPPFYGVPSFLPAQQQPRQHDNSVTKTTLTKAAAVLSIQGGQEYNSKEEDEDNSKYDSKEEKEAEPIAVTAKKLATATKSSIVNKKTKQTKARVSAVLSSSGTAVKSTGRGGKGIATYYRRYVPHIVRACLNPIMLVKMTQAYFASLVDIHNLREEPSQNLRSALEEKARKQSPSAGGASNKPKRKMKPGQAKTLSDLPQLSA